MYFHDYHLKGYSVRDNGRTRTIVLDLVYDYPDVEKRISRIEFQNVACYFFTHTAGAIITDIEEVELEVLVIQEAIQLEAFAHWHGLDYWSTNVAGYLAKLKAENFRAWRIESAIGFSGFVIGLEVEGSS